MTLTMRQISNHINHISCPQLGTPTIPITSDVLGYDDNVK